MQFCNLDFNLPEGLTGLVGDNGIGKSLLADIIRGSMKATTGAVEIVGPLIFFGQNSQIVLTDNETVAEHCGAAAKLKALKNIKNGSIEEKDYQIVGDDWLFANTFKVVLAKLSTQITPDARLAELSGGELNKVMLYRLFVKAQQQHGILILD